MIYIAFHIDDRAVFVVWSQHDVRDGRKAWFVREPEFWLDAFGKKRSCKLQLLREVDAGDIRVRWSLVTPRDGKPIGMDSLKIRVTNGGNSSSTGAKPLRFPVDRLERILEKSQQLLPDKNAERTLTLKEIREKLP